MAVDQQKAREFQDRKNAWRQQYDAAGRASLNDIGGIPPVADPELKESWRYDLHKFLVDCFPHSTGLSPLSEDHKRMIKRMEVAVLKGGRTLNAIFRGAAKTTIAENTALWALLFGHRKFLALIGADKTSGDEMIDSIKIELETNENLLAQFPEACYPIVRLEGKHQRTTGQTYKGERTHIDWTANAISLPTIPGAESTAGRVVCTGITGRIRGMKFKTPDGIQQRPDFVIIDDFQTEESARSAVQTEARLKTIRKAVLKLAGHNKTIAAVCNATVMEENDGVIQLIEDSAWMAERIPLVKKFADNHESFWMTKYRDIRTNYDPEDPEGQRKAQEASTGFYRQNREEADAGCIVTWESCYDHENELSAIQHAYNFLIDDGEDVFNSECQQEPTNPYKNLLMLTSKEIGQKTLRIGRGVAPKFVDYITSFIDVQQNSLWWSVVGWGSDFSGHVIDYGVWPSQYSEYYTARDLKKTLATEYPGITLDAQIFQALEDCTNAICKHYLRDDGANLTVSNLLVDAGWGESTDTVYKFCRNSLFPCTPSHGKSIRATQAPMREWKATKPKEKGHHYVYRLGKGRELRHVIVDTNYWKTFLHRRFRDPIGNPGSLTLFHQKASRHRSFTDQMLAEVPKEVTHGSRTIDEWSLKPDRPDNHWLDCMVGNCVAAAMLGIRLPEWSNRPTKTKKRRRRKATY